MGIITAGPVLAIVAPDAAFEGYGVEETEPMVVRRVRIPVALAAITTKGTFCILILPHQDLREDWPAPVAAFDLTCIVVLGLTAFHEWRSDQIALEPR